MNDYWPTNDKPRLLCIDKLQQFSGAIAQALAQWYNVRIIREPEPGHIGLADIIWCEWVDENAITVARMPRPDKVVFTRLHGYEAIEAGYPAQVDWRNVDALVSVSKQMLEYTESRYGTLPVAHKTVIHNAIDLTKYPFRPRKPGKDIAYLSLLNNKKNIAFLVLLAREFSDYTFHISGRWQDARLEEFFWYSKDTGKLDNLVFTGWHHHATGFLDGKNYLLNTSLWESFSFAIHEACAMGIKPLVHKWVSVDEFIPKNLQWGTVGELKALLDGPYESHRYREMAEAYDVRKIANQYHGMIEGLRTGKKMEKVE